MKIQVIGLPGSGKTTGITAFLEDYPSAEYVDFASFDYQRDYINYTEALDVPLVITESACGVPLIGSLVVQLEVPTKVLLSNLTNRDDCYDADYYSLLEFGMLKPDWIVRSAEELTDTLGYIVEQYATNRPDCRNTLQPTP